MPAMSKVPKGYPAKIKEAKKRIKKEVAKMEKMTSSMDIQNTVKFICQHYDVTNYYMIHETGKMQVDIDFSYRDLEPLSMYVHIDPRTKKYTLGDRIIVWTHLNDASGEEYWVDDYKW